MADAVADIASGASLVMDEFGLCGIPEALITVLHATGADQHLGICADGPD